MSENDHDVERADEYDFSQARRGPVLPPTPGQTRITLRLDTDIVAWFHAQVEADGGGHYQARINHALRTYIDRERGHPVRCDQSPRGSAEAIPRGHAPPRHS